MIKENINKIDYDLKNLFENVEVFEKSNRSNYYFEVNASSIVENKNTQVKVEISKNDLNDRNIKWSYYTNPVNESSDKIERVSTIATIAKDIHDVLVKRQMVFEYFESLEDVNESINESVAVSDEKTLEENVIDTLKTFGIESKLIEESKFNLDGSTPGKTLVYSQNLSGANMFLLESQLNLLGVEYVSFVNGTIKIKI